MVFKLLFLCFMFIFTPLVNAQEKLRVGHMLYSSLDASPKDIKITLSLWMDELAGTMGIEIDTHFYTSVEDMKDAMQNGTINYIIIRSIDLVKYFNQDNLIPGFAPQRVSSQVNTLLVVSSKKNKDHKIRDFKDKKLGLCRSQHIGKIYIDTLLLEDKLVGYEDYFSKVVEYKKCSKVLLDLFFKKIDIAVVNQGTYNLVNELNPQVGHSIAILQQRKLSGGMVGYFYKGTDKNLIAKFYDGIKKVNGSTRSKQILTLFKADYLQKTNEENLKELEAFYAKYLRLKKKGVK